MRPKYLAPVDSSITMVEALAHFLRGDDFPALGQPAFLQHLVPVLNRLPPRMRAALYHWVACFISFSPDDLGRVDAEALAEWVVGRYPSARLSPTLLIGSPNGAAMHMAAALGAPYLPQTFLLPVRQRAGHPDDVDQRAKGTVAKARRMLDANPEVQLHQLHDPVNDRPQLGCMDYFRIKYRALPAAYERFIVERLEPGGTLVVIDCRKQWPVSHLQDRHLFQVGGIGGVSIAEYYDGSERVAEFLEAHDSHRRRWDPQPADREAPEAEWGFEPSLLEDIQRLANERGYRITRLSFEEPEDLSRPVADLHRWWYRRRGIPDRRLLANCFFLVEPWWTLRTGSVPYWMVFNSSNSVQRLQHYLDKTGPFDEIGLTLLSNAVEAIGRASIPECEAVLARARIRGEFVGFDPAAYPRDLGVLTRYHTALKRMTDTRVPIPRPLGLDELDAFLAANHQPGLRWVA